LPNIQILLLNLTSSTTLKIHFQQLHGKQRALERRFTQPGIPLLK